MPSFVGSRSRGRRKSDVRAELHRATLPGPDCLWIPMRRAALIVALSLASLAVPAQAAEAPGAARTIRCHPHPNQAKRFAILEGEMPGSTTTRGDFRSVLLRAAPGVEFLRVEAPG